MMRVFFSQKELEDFQTKMKLNQNTNQIWFQYRLLIDNEYETAKRNQRTPTSEGAIVQLAKSCNAQYLANEYANQNIEKWPEEASFIVLVDTKNGNNTAVAFISFHQGRGNSGSILIASDTKWFTIDIICIVPGFGTNANYVIKFITTLLSATLYVALTQRKFSHVAIHLSEADRTTDELEKLYQKFGFREDKELRGYYTASRSKKTRGGGKGKPNDLFMSVELQKLPQNAIFNADLSPKFIPSMSPISPISTTTVAEDLKFASLEAELRMAKKIIADDRAKMNILQNQLQDALDQTEARKTKIKEHETVIETLRNVGTADPDMIERLNATIRIKVAETAQYLAALKEAKQNNEFLKMDISLLKRDISLLESSKTPEEQKDAIQKMLKRKDAEIVNLQAELDQIKSRQEAKRKKKREQAAQPVRNQPTVDQLIEQEEARKRQSEEARKKLQEDKTRLAEEEERKLAELRRAQEEDDRQRRLRKQEEEVPKIRIKKEPSSVKSPPHAISGAQDLLMLAVKTGSDGEPLSQEQKQMIIHTAADAIRNMETMKSGDATAYCKKYGCPICGDNEATHRLIGAIKPKRAKKEGAKGKSESGAFRARYNQIDAVALCNACYASLYKGTGSTLPKAIPFDQFAIQKTVLERKLQVLVAQGVVNEEASRE